ncbi:DUF5983 family protein [Pantoea cypripedii]|uniref:DUF5983 family protein n=1 Tax=Pantoea cypripedii TaxID=55209 RepID=UPI0039F25DE3
MVCSTSCVTRKDGDILTAIAGELKESQGTLWVIDLDYGWMVRPDLLEAPYYEMRCAGLSESTLRLMTEGVREFGVESVIFDRDGCVPDDWPVYDW